MDKRDDSKGKNEYFTRQKYSTKIGELKERYLHMPIDEKRKLYKCGSKYNTLNNVQTWEEYYSENKKHLIKMTAKKSNLGKTLEIVREVRPDLNKKVSLWRGDITTLEIDAIVNAANESLLGGGGVDGAIHRAAGKKLVEECSTLKGCKTGDAKITGGYKLPAKYVIHTVGPIGEQKSLLQSAYNSCLKLVKKNDLVSVAFPCISTGIYGYSSIKAAPVAIECVRNWLEDDEVSKKVERVIFCLFLQKDVDIYEELMQYYFPIVSQDPDGFLSIKNKEENETDTKEDSDDTIISKKVRTEEETTGNLNRENLKREPPSEKNTIESKTLKGTNVKTEVDSREEKDENMEVDSDCKIKDGKDIKISQEEGSKSDRLASPTKNEKEAILADKDQKLVSSDITKNKGDKPTDLKKEEKGSKPLTRNVLKEKEKTTTKL